MLPFLEKFDYAPLVRESIEGKRHYTLPDGTSVPSVTTILDQTKPIEKKQALEKWRNQVGAARAQQITTEAANRGTRMHTYLERYIKNGDLGDLPSNPYAQPSWFMAAQIILEGLNNVDEFWGCEIPLYYSGLYAGTTDCIGVWKGKPAIMDFKQSNKPKKEEWIDDYFLQLTAYALAHNNTYGTNIDTGVILMCVKPESNDAVPVYQEFVLDSEKFSYWKQQWISRVETYYSK